MVEITLHGAADSADVWRDLLANGGYQVYADASGNLHGVSLPAMTWGAGFDR